MGAIQTITAAAARLVTRKGREAVSSDNGLSAVAWDLWQTVPEVGAYADYISNAMSGATLYAGRRLPDGTVEKAPEDSRAAQLVATMAGGTDGQAVMLGEVGTQLAVPGEFWQIIIPATEPGSTLADARWLVRSTKEVKVHRGGLTTIVDGQNFEVPAYDPATPQDPSAPAAFRVWRASPCEHHLATSSVLRSITVLEELRLLSAAVAAIARSRLTGRGILLVPAGARFPTQPGQDSQEDSLLDTFIEIASTAIREPESAAATVPIVLEIPGDLIAGVKWLEFSSEFDALAQSLRDEAIRRFATGADTPAEALLGLGDANHWGAWAITAEALRLGVEPKLREYCKALTSEWMRPVLKAAHDPQAGEWMVWYDTSGLRSSSNKAANALEAHKQGLISDEAARRELGFTEADAPGTPAAAPAAGPDTALPVGDTQSPPEQAPQPLSTAAAVRPTPVPSPPRPLLTKGPTP